ncbi:DUF4350 domain-containing protein [Tumebacillus flagellatus]|uniref:DUF7408 domain-containing protein n=1 Tax=Tumebacillus flagellatus TaxID=1157490 RepID=A0A074LIF5_9BACL|nr:DUF4350 domain-containing protein [Tumebacillus flagellatus]KEO81991.1 hypothetical protein EL26_17620 [Tumebacillus flagellatus]
MKKKTRGRKTGAFLAAAVLTSALWAPAAWAASDLKMSSSVGWDGTFKLEAPTFVGVTIENQGEDLNGRLVVEPANPQNGGNVVSGVYEKEVVLPKGSTKTFQVEVPGGLFYQPVKVVLLDSQGKQLSDSNPSLVPVQDGVLLGGVSEKKDDLNVFSLVTSPSVGGKVTLKWLKNADLPDRAELLQGLDVLTINHAPAEKLTDEQVQTIREWVERGGTLLLSGGASYQGGGSLFQDLSPVKVTGTGKATDLTDLQRYTGIKPSVGELNVSTGSLVADAKVLVKGGSSPLIAERDFGAGHVLYAAYDLGEEPFASWQGNKELWGNVLREADLKPSHMPSQMNGAMRGVDQQMQLISSSQMFRDLLPGYKTSAVVFLGYIVLVGPLLYFVLRRLNRREWGWALIPATAILFTAGTLLFDDGPRSSGTRAQTAAIINLKSDKIAEVSAGSSFLVTKGGTYDVEFKENSFVYPSYLNMSGDSNAEARTVLGDAKPSIQYQNVEYWSLRSSFAQTTLNDQGRIQSDLHIDSSGSLTGQVTNKTKFDLEKVYLLIGNHAYKIDDLPTGKSLQVKQSIQTSASGTAPGISYMEQMFPYGMGVMDQELEQYRSLISYATSPWDLGTAPVQLVGFTKAPLNLYTINEKTVQKDTTLSLVRQVLPLQTDGSTSLPAGLIRPVIFAMDGNVFMSPEGLRMATGSATLEYKLKTSPDYRIDKVTTNFDSAAFAMYDKQIYNFKTGQWVPVAKENTPVITGDLLSQFVSPDGNLRVKFSTTTPQDQFLQYPAVAVEGKVSQ